MRHIMKYRLVSVLIAAFGLSGVITSRANADYCTYCLVHVGCWVHQEDGWLSCTNLGGGDCLLEGDCIVTLASARFALDGTRLVFDSDDSRNSGLLALPDVEPKGSVTGGPLLSASLVDRVGAATYVRSRCDNSIIARTYSADAAQILRDSARSIFL